MSNYMPGSKSERAYLEQKYNTSRMNLLLVVLFTIINLVLLVANADTYFLFSAFIPYYVAILGMILCGRMPDGFYNDPEYVGMEFFDNSFFIATIAIAVILTLFYLLAWFMSNKNRVGWLVFALVFFIIDTIGMFIINGIAVDSIIDIIFHAWVIYYLIVGVTSGKKLQALPVDNNNVGVAAPAVITQEIGSDLQEPAFSSTALRDADTSVKFRVLLEAHVLNYDICYRRVKFVNELVVNGTVYDELRIVAEGPHTLQAIVDGHNIQAVYNGLYSIITFDGEILQKKIRWF